VRIAPDLHDQLHLVTAQYHVDLSKDLTHQLNGIATHKNKNKKIDMYLNSFCYSHQLNGTTFDMYFNSCCYSHQLNGTTYVCG
jgi:hypothetical protein